MESTVNDRKCLRRASMATKSAQTPGHKLARTLRFKTRKPKQKRNGQHEDDPGISNSYESQNSNPIALDNPSNPALSNSRSLLITTVPKSLVLFEGSKVLSADFFQIDALELAPRLLGKLLRRDDVLLQITEVEAYRPNDTACHGRFGITARTAPVFGPGGHAYVYLCYGLHTMLNVVADKEGVGAAVLIRSCAPISGLETIQQRRGLKTDKPVLLAGPGKVGQALGISVAWSNHPLYIPGGLEILEGPIPEKISIGPRVGIEYASPEHVNALWRFAIADSPWISAPKNTLRPP